MPSAPGAPLLLTTRWYARLRLAGVSTRSISVSGSAFVHVTDDADACALPTVVRGYRPELRFTVLPRRIFCFSTFDETLTPTGGITCSALGDAVIRHLLRLRLTSVDSSQRLATLGSPVANLQISQGNSRDLPAYACRIYAVVFRASIGLWLSLRPHPTTTPLSASCTSGQHFASGFLQIRGHPRHPCLWLTLPLAGCVEDFHLQVTSEATTAKLVALARNAPCLAHNDKGRNWSGLCASRQCGY